MHCEHAPWSRFVRVAASIHDSEGRTPSLQPLWNPFLPVELSYKSALNFFGYADGQEYANLGPEG